MPKQVLIVEDERLLARTLGTALKEAGYDAVVAHTAEQGHREWGSTGFDLVILDNRLPAETGIQMLERARSEGRKAKVILMSAFDADGVEESMAELQIDLYVRKPFDLNSMLGHVETLLGTKSGLGSKSIFSDRGAPR